MKNLAAFIMRGKVQALSAVTAFTVMSWLLPLLSLLASAAVALPTLRRGALEGGVIVAGAALLTGLAGAALNGEPGLTASYSLALSLPTWLAAVVFRESGRLQAAVLTVTGLAALLVLGVYAWAEDPAKLWIEGLSRFIGPNLESSAVDADVAGRLIQGFARLLTGAVVAGSAVTVIASTLLGRWWQAGLYNPGGFLAEFIDLRMPTAPAWLSVLLIGVASVGDGETAEVAGNLAFPSLVPFLFTGLAVLHGGLSNLRASPFWIVGAYVLLIMIPYALAPVMLLGLSDPWANWRDRWGRAAD